jgi:PAS domain S-box-containing protein
MAQVPTYDELQKRVQELETQTLSRSHIEEMYRLLVEHSLQGLVIIQEAHIVFANAAFTEISGYTIDELLSLSPDEVRAIIHPEDQALVWKRFQARLEGKPTPPRYEYRGIRKDGTVRWLEMVASRIEFRGKHAIQGAIFDVTDRKQAEEALLESEEKYRLFVENANEGIVLTKDGKLTYINPRALEVMGYPEDEMISRSLMDFIHPDDRDRVLRLYFQKLKGEDLPPSTYRIIDKYGSTKWVESRSTALTYEGKPALLTFLIDITERKRTEEALRESKEFLQSVFDAIQDGVSVLDTDFNILRVNSWIESMYADEAPLVGKKCYAVYQKRNTPCPWCPTLRTIETGETRSSVVLCPSKKHPTGWIDLSAFPLKDAEGQVVGIIDYVKDITEQKKAQEALRESEERYRSLFNRLPVGAFRSTPDGQFLDANPAFTRLLGCPDLETVMSTPVTAFYRDPEEREQWKRLIEKEGGSSAMELQWQKLDGTPFWVRQSARVVRDSRGRVQCYEGVAEDITELKRSEEEQRHIEAQLQHAQRMEAIGTLAGGIAHDFNNILSAIIGYTEIVLFHEPSEGSTARHSLDQVLSAAERAKDLVKHILAFSRQAEEERRPVLLEPLVKEALKLLRATLPSTIEIRQSIAPHADYVMADPTQIHQVLMNLCTNAFHAMREEGGVLEVRLESTTLNADESAARDLRSGKYLALIVRDTGCGMSPEVAVRIFDPYFTTKEKAVGTGLGLAVVHGIVKGHGGSISMESEPGKGSTFTVYLPLIKHVKLPETAEGQKILPTGVERILFIDDEPALVDIGKQMLERLGYQVVTRTSSTEALEYFRSAPDEFDLVITDQTMPRMTGDMLAGELMKLKPEIPIIICTGFSEKISEQEAITMGLRAFLMKPLVISDLANTIRRILDKEQ